jgi:hypothetical protein
VPRAYAERAGIANFPEFLRECGRGQWRDFFEVADAPEEITFQRPFYPRTYLPKGAKLRSHLTAGLGLAYDDLLRRCDRAGKGRRAACGIFWTCGVNQVGKGAISGWRLLQDEPRTRTRFWLFDGQLDDLMSEEGSVIFETYPTEFSRQLGLGTMAGKRKREVRRMHGPAIMSAADRLDIEVHPSLERQVLDGFGLGNGADDRFNAVIGLLGMLNVVLGRRSPGNPRDDLAVKLRAGCSDSPICDCLQAPRADS